MSSMKPCTRGSINANNSSKSKGVGLWLTEIGKVVEISMANRAHEIKWSFLVALAVMPLYSDKILQQFNKHTHTNVEKKSGAMHTNDTSQSGLNMT